VIIVFIVYYMSLFQGGGGKRYSSSPILQSTPPLLQQHYSLLRPYCGPTPVYSNHTQKSFLEYWSNAFPPWALRSEIRRALHSCFGFLKLFDTALSKLPTVKKAVWRGIPGDISH